jgi:hypothetical protein
MDFSKERRLPDSVITQALPEYLSGLIQHPLKVVVTRLASQAILNKKASELVNYYKLCTAKDSTESFPAYVLVNKGNAYPLSKEADGNYKIEVEKEKRVKQVDGSYELEKIKINYKVVVEETSLQNDALRPKYFLLNNADGQLNAFQRFEEMPFECYRESFIPQTIYGEEDMQPAQAHEALTLSIYNTDSAHYHFYPDSSKTRGDGYCFFHALYQALLEKGVNLVDYVKECFRFSQTSYQKRLAGDIFGKLNTQTPDFKRWYQELSEQDKSMVNRAIQIDFDHCFAKELNSLFKADPQASDDNMLERRALENALEKFEWHHQYFSNNPCSLFGKNIPCTMEVAVTHGKKTPPLLTV